MKLRVQAERIYPESQCEFRTKRATIDMIFSLRQLQEKCRKQEKPLYVIAFIGLTKAFDLVSRDGLFTILAMIGCPPTLLSIVKSFHDNMKGTVLYDGATSLVWREARLCPCPYTVWNLFCHTPKTCFWKIHKRHLLSNQIRWESV